MGQEQNRVFETVGDLKRELQAIPDDAKLSFGTEQSSGMGVSLQRNGNSVIFGANQQSAGAGRQQT